MVRYNPASMSDTLFKNCIVYFIFEIDFRLELIAIYSPSVICKKPRIKGQRYRCDFRIWIIEIEVFRISCKNPIENWLKKKKKNLNLSFCVWINWVRRLDEHLSQTISIAYASNKSHRIAELADSVAISTGSLKLQGQPLGMKRLTGNLNRIKRNNSIAK